jgi:PIN domain nuclease of toxin-antitoxin system
VKYLLDTMVWLWSVGPVENLRREARDILRSGEEEISFSAVSSWEIAIKVQLGKYTLPELPGAYVPKRLSEQGIRSLPITLKHTLGVYDLPLHHRDPFDRLIISQALAEEMTILTADRIFRKYPVRIIWCRK